MKRQPSDSCVRSYLVGRWLFLRVLGVVFAFAFASVWPQAPGLIGTSGIRPSFVSSEPFALENLLTHPTLFWISGSDFFLGVIAAVGFFASLLLVLDRWPRIACATCYVAYLSFAAAEPFGATLVFFAWPPDLMLLEAAVWGCLLAPPGARPGLARTNPPSRIVLCGTWFFFFRMMFPSGLVKILHGQPQWLDLTVLEYHMVTLPFPATLSWFAFNYTVPWITKSAAITTFALEVIAPFAILIRGWPRRWTGLATIAFMVCIQLTGNYRWINLITVAVALTLIDDRSIFLRWILRRTSRSEPESTARPPNRIKRSRLGIATAFVLTTGISLVGASHLLDDFYYRDPSRADAPTPPEVFTPLRRVATVARVGATHKLFHGIALDRRVIVIEGSRDGVQWHPYQCFAVPGALDVAPQHFAPYHRYLDFGLWGAGTAPWSAVRDWYDGLITALLKGSPAVERLFANVPFRDRPPRYIRSTWWLYRYTTPRVRARTGRWWERHPAPIHSLRPPPEIAAADWSTTEAPITPYAPVATLDADGNLAAATLPEAYSAEAPTRLTAHH